MVYLNYLNQQVVLLEENILADYSVVLREDLTTMGTLIEKIGSNPDFQEPPRMGRYMEQIIEALE